MEINKNDIEAYGKETSDADQKRRIESAAKENNEELLRIVEELFPVTEQEFRDWKGGEGSDDEADRVELQLKFQGSTARLLNDDFHRRLQSIDQVDWGKIGNS